MLLTAMITLVSALVISAALPPGMPTKRQLPLSFDSIRKSQQSPTNGVTLTYTFSVTNSSDTPFRIDRVKTSCGCTVAEMPRTPWTMLPNESGKISVSMDTKGKYGRVIKTVMLFTQAGPTTLMVEAELPAFKSQTSNEDMNRRRNNIAKALQDRQTIFKGDCASCHVTPGIGKVGKPLYVASCGICHDAEHRAAMVPSLMSLPKPTSPEYWEHWIRGGREGSLMPAFDAKHGGPLTEEQITSLVDFLNQAYPNRYPGKKPVIPVTQPATK